MAHAQQYDGDVRPFPAAAAIAVHLRVKNSGGKVAVAGIGDADLGTVVLPAYAADEVIPIRLPSASGTRKMIASEAVTAFAPVFQAASGKVAASGTYLVGYALQAASADGDVIEVLTSNVPLGLKVVGGIATLASGTVTIDTKLTAVVAGTANINASSAPGLDPGQLGTTVSGANLTITAWKPTSVSNPTLIASSSTATVCWTAVGY